MSWAKNEQRNLFWEIIPLNIGWTDKYMDYNLFIFFSILGGMDSYRSANDSYDPPSRNKSDTAFHRVTWQC